MTENDLLELIENVLAVEPNTLSAAMSLDSIPQWDSLNMLNLQIELTALRPDVSFDALRECKTVGDICRLV